MATTAPVLVAALALLAGTPDELAKRFAHHYEGPARASLAQSISPARSHSPPVGSVEPAGAQPLWPQMVHMTLTGRPGEAVIEWVSGAPPNSSVVQLSAEPGCCDSPECPCFPCKCSSGRALILSPRADLRSFLLRRLVLAAQPHRGEEGHRGRDGQAAAGRDRVPRH